MPRRKRPHELRCLHGLAIAAPLLMLGWLLALAEGPACELLLLGGAGCPMVPDLIYQSLFGAAAACLLHCVYRAYRDFYKGELERDLAERRFL